jgi:YVTN family beta-propeller protein
MGSSRGQPEWNRIYVANCSSGTVSVIDTVTNATIGDPIPVGDAPVSAAVSPDGTRLYVTNGGDCASMYPGLSITSRSAPDSSAWT